jgi:DNA-binding IclR family transcriptional regulator
MTPADSIVFLLRHMGAQRTRDLADSVGMSFVELDRVLVELQAARRIEPDGRGKWRLIPSAAAPTHNPGTR